MPGLKRFLILAVAVLLAVSAGTVVAAPPRVEKPGYANCDITGHWAAPYACDLKNHGLLEGDSKGYRLDDATTRAEFVTLLVRALGRQPQSGGSYTDLQEPDLPITRQDAFVMLARAVAGPKLAEADLRVLDGYADAKQAPQEVKQALAFAMLVGAVEGNPDKSLKLEATLTRGQAAKLIALMLPEILPAGIDKVSLVLYNDFHGHLAQDSRARAHQDVGIERLTSAIMGQLLKNPNSILIDGGDSFQGTPVSNLVYGASTTEWRNRLGVTIAGVGNHEFDWNISTLKKLLVEARHPTVTANIFLAGTNNRPEWAVPTITLTVGGYKVGVIGITTPETKSIVLPEAVEGLEFRDPAVVVDQEARKLRSEGADLVIVVSHASASPGKNDPFKVENEVAQWMARVNERIDAVTGAHSHEMTAGYVLDAAGEMIPVIQAGSYGRALARIDLYIDKASRVPVKAIPVVWEPAQTLAPTPWAADLLAKWTSEIKPIISRPVGKLVRPLSRRTTPAGESALGDFIADSMLMAGPGIQIAFMNGGGIRADLEGEPGTGMVNWGHLFTVMPFGNTLVTVEMTGAQVKLLLEQGVDSYIKQLRNQPGGHSPMQVSGIAYAWDFAKPMGQRVDPASLKLPDGSPLDFGATYKVVVNSFMAGGGDDLTILKELKAKQVDLGVIDLDVMVEHFKRLVVEKPLDYSLQNRVTVTNLPN